MRDYVEERVKELADKCIATGMTVRELAKVSNTSKSTVHKDLTERLLKVNPEKAEEVKVVLQKNKDERHIRGGIATREMYKKRRTL